MSIPVNQILPQSLSKDMNATVAEQVNWNITKTPSSANLAFGNVCDQTLPLKQPLTITVDWTASQPAPNGPVTVTTHVYATNPSARVITATVNDTIYLGLSGQGTPLHTATPVTMDLLANSTTLVMTDTFSDPDNTHTTYNDVATATYVDKVTGVPIPGDTTASASTTVISSGTTNSSATIDDVESISPAAFTFSLDSFNGTGGYTGGSVTSPAGYTLGTQVPSVTWDSTSVSSDGEVVFTKTIAFNGTGGGSATGTMTDTAEVKNGDQILAKTTAQVTGVSSTTMVNLTINKTITPAPLAAGANPVTFTFDVVDGFSQPVPGSPFTLTFGPGDSSKSTGAISLVPSVFSITERPATGWITDTTTHTVDLSANNANQCTGSVNISNTEQGHIIVTKVTDPSTDTSTSFSFNTTGSGYGSFSLVGNGASHDSGPLDPGSYAVAEDLSGLPSWKLTTSTCDGGNTPASITLAAGQTVNCAFTNTESAHLTLVKTVTNDNGGTAVPTDFTLSAAGPTPISGAGGADSDVNAGSYTLSETNVKGYTAGAWSCVGGTQTGSTVALTSGQSATCTINNNDQPPALHLRKVVINDNGGTALATAWTLTANGGSAGTLSGTTPVDSGASFQTGTYALSESGPSGYAASAWVCVGGTQTGSNIAVGLGESATCTITNNDQTAHLKLVKVVNNTHGGTAVATNFTLSASGPTPVSGAGGAESDVNAGTYNLSETSVSGYTPSAWSCVGGTQSGSSVTLTLGQSATCTITNSDQTAHLTLVKKVNNTHGGTAVLTNFTLSASGPTPISGAGGANSDVNAGTYNLSETTLYGYTASAWSCVGGTQTGSSIALALGQSATCTITNSDVGGTIIIQKIAKPNTGSFNFTTTGTGYTGFTIQGSGSNTQTGLSVGTYTAKEGTQLGWILDAIGSDPANQIDPNACTVTGSGGSSGEGNVSTQTATINLKNGDTVTCVFENTGQGATRTQGFWATHPNLANLAWFGGSGYGHTFPGATTVPGIGDMTLCTPVTKDMSSPLTGLGRLMGGFWSGISKTSTNKSRSALDQARMQLAQQLLAAELNASAFGSVPPGGSGSFGTWEKAYCGTSQTAISNALQGASSFNSQGDNSNFTPGTAADSKTARSIANIPYWDVLP